MTIQVIALGMFRTGTKSTQMALEKLGYKTYHMSEAIDNPKWDFWMDAYDRRDSGTGSTIDFSQVFSDYQATTEFPGTGVWRELLAAYPEAHFILQTRDADSWYESSRATVYETAYLPIPDDQIPVPARYHLPFARKHVWENMFHGKFATDPEVAKKVYQEHYDQVLATIPKDRLLVWKVQDGWEPLCKFLGKDVPNEPFPHANRREVIIEMIQGVISGQLKEIDMEKLKK